MTNTDEEARKGWDALLVERVGRAIKKARKGRSAKWLAEETARLGYPISQTVIAKLDSGHRGGVLQVAELIVLARALGVPPLQLLYPDQPDGPVRYLPNDPSTTPAVIAAELFSGEIEGGRHDITVMRLARELARIEGAAVARKAELSMQRDRTGGEDRTDEINRELRALAEDLRRQRQRVFSQMSLVDYPWVVTEDDDPSGMLRYGPPDTDLRRDPSEFPSSRDA